MNRTPDQIIDAMAFCALDGGASAFLMGDNEMARLITEWRSMRVQLASASIRDVLRIERRQDGLYYVMDNRGANAVEFGPHHTFEAAQDAWSEVARDVLGGAK